MGMAIFDTLDLDVYILGIFFPIPSTYLCIRQMARLGLLFHYINFFPLPYTTAPGYEPTSVELHHTGTFEGCSTD